MGAACSAGGREWGEYLEMKIWQFLLKCKVCLPFDPETASCRNALPRGAHNMQALIIKAQCDGAGQWEQALVHRRGMAVNLLGVCRGL